MKKILTLIAIATISLSSIFAVVAETGNSNKVNINGSVAEDTYTFDLIYEDEIADLSNSSLDSKVFDLTVEEFQSTEKFHLKRSNGNLNTNLRVTMDITSEAFVGNVNGEEVTTTIVPIIQQRDRATITYENVQAEKTDTFHNKTFFVTIPYGYNPDSDVDIATFSLNIKGDKTIDAGVYTSNVVINYTYDQD